MSSQQREKASETSRRQSHFVGLAAATLFGLLAASHLMPSASLHAGEIDGAPPDKVVRVVTLLTEDDEGNELRFPSAVAYDRDMQEIYAVNGGRGGIVIYDADYFPHLFLGAGRGIDSPQGVFFDKAGLIYVCQGRTSTKPPRLTILNAALFVQQEITFENLPEAPDFLPIRGVVSQNGTIYLVGNSMRGAAVFSKEGTFLRWLKPLDRVRPQAPPKGEGNDKEELEAPSPLELNAALAGEEKEPGIIGDAEPPAPEAGGLPAELRPRLKNKLPEAEKKQGLDPVELSGIAIDSDGHLFLLSEETSKVYVYGADETLLFSFGQKGGSSGKMSRPRAIAIDEEKRSIYVLDYMRHAVLVFDYGGNYMTEFGGRGTGPLWFNFPSDLAIDREGRLLIADLFNNRIQVLKPEFTISFPKYQGVKSSSEEGGDKPPARATEQKEEGTPVEPQP